MLISVGEDHILEIKRLGVFSGLFLADQGIFILCFCFQHNKRLTFIIEEQKIHKAILHLIKIFAQACQISFGHFDIGFQLYICRSVFIVKETPASFF